MDKAAGQSIDPVPRICPVHQPSLAFAPALLVLILAAGCNEPSSDEGDAGDDTTETGEECPVGSEGCPCTGGGGCDAGLACSAELVCEPEPACPIGSDGCPCTEGGSCDEGFSCIDDGSGSMVCGCEPGTLGCECLEGEACGGGLDCSSETETCEIPELDDGPANGWGEVTCWQYGGPDEFECYAPRGDVHERVYAACDVAERVLSGEWTRSETWESECSSESVSFAEPWSDAACFISASGPPALCLARIGHLWASIVPDCKIAEQHTFEPWGVDEGVYGCDPLDWPPAPPVENDVDGWRCGTLPGSSSDVCAAQRAGLWTFPRPGCPYEDAFGYEQIDGWPADHC